MILDEIRNELFKMQDTAYRDFNSKLIPTVDKSLFIGVRTSELRKYAKQLAKREDIEEKIKELNAKRREKQPLEYPSAGSTFKRPETGYASLLTEEAGLKGTRIGGAEVSKKHSGFIINADNATAKDVKDLISYVQKVVEEKSGVKLYPEVKML